MKNLASVLSCATCLFLFGGCTAANPDQLPDVTIDGSDPESRRDLGRPPADLGMPPGDMAMGRDMGMRGDMAMGRDMGMGRDLGMGRDMAPPPPGCTGKAMMPPGTTTQMMTSGSKTRTYLLHVPPLYDPSKPTPLVFAFHGLSDKATDYIKYINIEAEADARNVIAVVPQGLGFVPGWNAGNCCGEPQLWKVDDVGFTRNMITALERDFCIDSTRIYAMGFSNGGMFVHRLACEMADVLAAVGPVSGGPMVPTCTPAKPISLLHMHGTADPVCGYHGGGIGTFPDIPMAIDAWAMRDSCTGAAMQTYMHGAVTCMTYETCAEMAEVGLCTVTGGVHAWPGSSDGTPDINGTATILDFFANHRR